MEVESRKSSGPLTLFEKMLLRRNEARENDLSSPVVPSKGSVQQEPLTWAKLAAKKSEKPPQANMDADEMVVDQVIVDDTAINPVSEFVQRAAKNNVRAMSQATNASVKLGSDRETKAVNFDTKAELEKISRELLKYQASSNAHLADFNKRLETLRSDVNDIRKEHQILKAELGKVRNEFRDNLESSSKTLSERVEHFLLAQGDLGNRIQTLETRTSAEGTSIGTRLKNGHTHAHASGHAHEYADKKDDSQVKANGLDGVKDINEFTLKVEMRTSGAYSNLTVISNKIRVNENMTMSQVLDLAGQEAGIPADGAFPMTARARLDGQPLPENWTLGDADLTQDGDVLYVEVDC